MASRQGVFIDRPNRFTARVRFPDDEVVLVHVASSGRMTELLMPGVPAVVTGQPQPGRKTAGRLSMVRAGNIWVSVDTSVPGKVLREAFYAGTIPAFAGYSVVRAEYTFGTSRLDFLLSGGGLPPCLVEVKSVTTAVPDADGSLVARFPDAPTYRGTRHLGELAVAVKEGFRAAACFVIQRSDAVAYGPYDRIDPQFGEALRSALAQGVESYGFQLIVTPEGVRLGNQLPLRT